jgi:hypothetical protein
MNEISLPFKGRAGVGMGHDVSVPEETICSFLRTFTQFFSQRFLSPT